VDFKRDLSSRKSVLKDIVAFANTAGGAVVIGVDDDGSVVGVADPLREEEQRCSPSFAAKRLGSPSIYSPGLQWCSRT
jgi:predicted HTH transcriptional regulator